MISHKDNETTIVDSEESMEQRVADAIENLDRDRAQQLLGSGDEASKAFKDYLFRQLSRAPTDVDDQLLSKVRFIFNIGVDSCCNHGYSGSPINTVIYKESLPLVRLIIEYNGHHYLPPIPKRYQSLYKDSFEYAAEDKITPLQIAIAESKICCTPVKQQIVALLQKRCRLPFQIKSLQRDANEIYKHLHHKIKQEKAFAESNGKSLILMIGETHEGIDSLLVESIVLHITNKLGISLLLTEYNQRIMQYVSTHNGRHPQGVWKVGESIYQLAQTLGISIMPVDVKHDISRKLGWINKRNKAMCEEVNQNVKQHAVQAIGALHFPGLLNEHHYDDSFHVVPINPLFPNSQPEELKSLYDSEDFLNVSELFSEEYDLSFISIELAVEIASKAEQNFLKITNCQQTLWTSPSDNDSKSEKPNIILAQN